jgi:predicted transcriptional regulator
MSSAGTVRISDSARRALRELAQREAVPMQTVLDRAIEDYRRKRFLDAVNKTFADLRGDTTTWADETHERREWDASIGDAIDNE